MANMTNLRQVRKSNSRAADRTRGDANAAKFGLSKADKQAATAKLLKAAKHLDGHKRDTDPSNT